MIGNVWEWTTDWYSPKHEADAPKACCIPENPRGGARGRELRPVLSRISKFPAKSSKAARICARRITAAATARPRAMPSRSTRRQAMSASDASSEINRKRAHHEYGPRNGKSEDSATPNSEGVKRRDLLLSGSSLVAASACWAPALTTPCESAATDNGAVRQTAEHRRHHG